MSDLESVGPRLTMAMTEDQRWALVKDLIDAGVEDRDACKCLTVNIDRQLLASISVSASAAARVYLSALFSALCERYAQGDPQPLESCLQAARNRYPTVEVVHEWLACLGEARRTAAAASSLTGLYHPSLVKEWLTGGCIPGVDDLTQLALSLPQAAERSSAGHGPERSFDWQSLRGSSWFDALGPALDGCDPQSALAVAWVVAVDLLAGRGPVGLDGWAIEHKRWGYNQSELSWLGQRVSPTLPGAEFLDELPLASAWLARLRRPTILSLDASAPAARVPCSAEDADGSAAGWLAVTVAGDLPNHLHMAVAGTVDDSGRLGGPLTAKTLEDYTAFDRSALIVVPESWRQQFQPKEALRFGQRQLIRPSHASEHGRLISLPSTFALRFTVGAAPAGPHRQIRAAMREHLALTRDWIGREVATSGFVSLPLSSGPPPRRPSRSEPPWMRRFTTDRSEWTAERVARCRRDPTEPLDHRGFVVMGGPGAGKSVVLRQIGHRLTSDDPLVSAPALWTHARDIASGPVSNAVAKALLGLTAEAVESALADDAIRAEYWLLVDGLDELPRAQRRRAIRVVEGWPGPFVVATRRIAESTGGAEVLTMRPLSGVERASVLAFEERSDLNPRLDLLLDDRDRTHWVPQLRAFAETPLGLSLLASAWSPDEPAPAAATLIEGALQALLDRARDAGRLSERLHLRLGRRALRLVGALALVMIQHRRGRFSRSDIDTAERRFRLSESDVDDLQQLIEAGGLVEPVGADEWAFGHKSIGEYCAAWFLHNELGATTSPDKLASLGFFSAVGEPGVDAVYAHMAGLMTDATPVIERLLEHTERPFSALRVALVTLAGAGASAIMPEAALTAFARAIGVILSLSSEVVDEGVGHLPGGLEDLGPLIAAAERFAGVFVGRRTQLLVNCSAEALEVVAQVEQEGDANASGSSSGTRVGRSMLATVVALWNTALPAPLVEAVGEEPSEPNAEPSTIRLEPGLLARVALPCRRDAAADCQGSDDLLSVARALLERGNTEARRDALLRLALRARIMNDLMTTTYGHSVAAQAADEMARQLMEIEGSTLAPWWQWSLRVGFVPWSYTAVHKTSEERVVDLLLLPDTLDEDWAVRWVATRAIRRLDTSAPAWLARILRWPLPDEFLVDRLRDDSPYVRVEALMTLIARGRPPTARAMTLCLGSPHLDERWVALRALQVRNPEAFFDLWLRRPLVPDRDPSRTESSWAEVDDVSGSVLGMAKRALRDHGETARTEVLDGLRECLDSAIRWRQVAELLPRPDLPSASSVLGKRLGRDRPGLEYCPIGVIWWGLHHRVEAIRDWAYGLLSAFRLGRVTSTAMHGYIASLWPPDEAEQSEDWSPRSVGQHALAHVRRNQPQPAFAPEAPRPGAPTDLAFDEAKAFGMASTPGAYSGSARGQVSVNDLLQIDDFETAWNLLATHEIPFETEADMDGYSEAMKEGNFDSLIELRMMAGSMNAMRARPLVQHLASVCPEDGRKRLLDNIDHPSLGFWAEAILSAQPPARDVLACLGRSVMASRRVAQLMSRTFLAEETAHRLIDLLLDGTIDVEPPDPERYSLDKPWWCARLVQMAGADAAIRLLAQDRAPAVQAWVLKMVGHRATQVFRGAGSISPSTQRVGATWARDVLSRDDLESLEHLALLVLGLTGDGRDLERLRAYAVGIVADEKLPPDPESEKPFEQYERTNPEWSRQVELASAAVRGLVRLGTPADLAWVSSRPLELRIAEFTLAAVEGQIDVHGAECVPWLIKLLEADIEDESVESATGYGARMYGGWRRVAFHALVEWGDRAVARRLSRVAVHYWWGLELLRRLGHLPEHALLGIAAEWLEDSSDENSSLMGFGRREAAMTSSRQLVERVARNAHEETRRALLEFALDLEGELPPPDSEDEPWRRRIGPSGLAMKHFEDLGGFKSSDRTLLRAHLVDRPKSRVALQGLAEMGDDEKFIGQVWSSAQVDWWPGPG